jgi:phosphatidylserine decarboxylase
LGRITHRIIRRFVARYGVNMAEAADPRIESYASFNEFFTRPLKPGARPLADARWVCPVDGAISQFGAIERDQIFQAKGHHYSTWRWWAATLRWPRSLTTALLPRSI